jgi:hypothetical protein
MLSRHSSALAQTSKVTPALQLQTSTLSKEGRRQLVLFCFTACLRLQTNLNTTLEFCISASLELWNSGTLELWNSGTLGLWNSGIQAVGIKEVLAAFRRRRLVYDCPRDYDLVSRCTLSIETSRTAEPQNRQITLYISPASSVSFFTQDTNPFLSYLALSHRVYSLHCETTTLPHNLCFVSAPDRNSRWWQAWCLHSNWTS